MSNMSWRYIDVPKEAGIKALVVYFSVEHRAMKNLPAIYKISCGDKYYIGRSEKVLYRIRGHSNAIKRALHGIRIDKAQHGLLGLIMSMDDKCIELIVSVVEECSIADLCNRERYWVSKHIADDNCLNRALENSIKITGLRAAKISWR